MLSTTKLQTTKEQTVIKQRNTGFLIAAVMFLAASCATDQKTAPLVPNATVIEVFKNDCNESAPIVTQTTDRTCAGTLPADPPNVACQTLNETTSAAHKIYWVSDDGQFTLEFPDGTPFKGVNGAPCQPGTAKDNFRCIMASSNSPGIKPMYKYDVVFEDGNNKNCRLDPHILLR